MNNTNKMLFGVGINDSNYTVYPTINRKRVVCQYYRAWSAMLTRCYHEITQKSRPAYIGCTVCKEWRRFSVFKSWMMQKDWKNKHLDKDIIVPGNKIYSPDTCCFVSQEVNQLLTNNKARRGPYPQGVHLDKKTGKYHSMVRINSKKIFLGAFDAPEDARTEYIKMKKSNILKIAKTQPEPIRSGLLKHAELLNNKEEQE